MRQLLNRGGGSNSRSRSTLVHVQLFSTVLTVNGASAAGTYRMSWQQLRTGLWLHMLAT
jgi:hypothetical protein